LLAVADVLEVGLIVAAAFLAALFVCEVALSWTRSPRGRAVEDAG
jgi:hypothetical protein